MTYEEFTIKTQEAILKAQQLAGAHNQQQVDTVHIFRAIHEKDDQVTTFLFQKTGANLNKAIEEADRFIKTYPQIEGSDKQYIKPNANTAHQNAREESRSCE